MLKKYLDFINESNLDEIVKKYHSLGEYIESLSENDSYILNLVAQYTENMDPTIRLANVVNILDKEKQKELLIRIDNYKNDNQSQDIDVTAYAGVVSENTDVLSGKNMFKCFLKSLTALGLKNTDLSKTKPDDWLFYFKTNEVSVDTLKSIMSRYRHFDYVVNTIEYKHNDCSLYYGIKLDLTFEYGIKTEDQVITIGKFKITKGIINWLLTLDSPSSVNIKKVIVGLNVEDLYLVSKIVPEMKKWRIGDSEKRSGPIFNNGIMSFGFYGVGKWSAGQLDQEDFENVKTNIKRYLSNYKWADKIKVNVTFNDFWIWINIKIK